MRLLLCQWSLLQQALDGWSCQVLVGLEYLFLLGQACVQAVFPILLLSPSAVLPEASFLAQQPGVSPPAGGSFGKSCRPVFYIKPLNGMCAWIWFLNSSLVLGHRPSERWFMWCCVSAFAIFFLLFVNSVLRNGVTRNLDWNVKFCLGSRSDDASRLGAQAIDNVKCFHLSSFSRRLDLSVNGHPLGALTSLQLLCDPVHMWSVCCYWQGCGTLPVPLMAKRDC